MPDITDFHVGEMTPSVFDHQTQTQTIQAEVTNHVENKDQSSSIETKDQSTPPTQHHQQSTHSKNYMDIVQLTIQLTSPEKIDYEIVSDLFLTYRSFLSPSTLLQLLILRFKWALQCFDDTAHNERHLEGEKVLVRTFTVIRHWLLNYFKDDFASETQLRLLFVNYFAKLSHSDFAVQRIIDNLQKTYNDQSKRAVHDPDHSPQYRNSVIMNSVNDRVLPNIPMQHSKRDPKLFLNPKNSNLRLSQAISNAIQQREESPLFISLSKNPITRNVVTQTTAFPTNSALSKIIPPTPVKKMEVIVKLPTPPHSASSSTSSSSASKTESKGLKSLIDKWTYTFNTNKQTINKDVQVEKFMRRVVSLPKLNDKELEELVKGKFDILSARTIDQVEYLFKFQNELLNRHSQVSHGVFGRDSFSFTVDEDINKSNIDNMNLCGYISNLSRSVVSLQQQASDKSYVTYDSDLSRNNTSLSREFDFESREENLEEGGEQQPVLKKVDTIEEFNNHFSVISQSTRNMESFPAEVPIPPSSPHSKRRTNESNNSIAEEVEPSESEVKQTLKPSSTEETLKNLLQPDDGTTTPTRAMKTSPTEETIKNLAIEESEVVEEPEEVKDEAGETVPDLEGDAPAEVSVESVKEVEVEISAPAIVDEAPTIVDEAPVIVDDTPVNEVEVVEKDFTDDTESKNSSFVEPDEFDFVDSQSQIGSPAIPNTATTTPIIPNSSTLIKSENESEDEIDDVVSLYSEESQKVQTPNSAKLSIDRKSVLLRSLRRTKSESLKNSRRDTKSTFGDNDSFMTSYDEPIQDTMSSNNVTDSFNGPTTPTMHDPTPHVSPIKSIVENQEFEDKVDSVGPIRIDLNRIPSFTRISNSHHSINIVNARDSYLSSRCKNTHVSFHSDMMSTSSIFTPVRGRQKFVHVSVAPTRQDHEEDDDADEAEMILQKKHMQMQQQQQQKNLKIDEQLQQQRDVSLQTVESDAFDVPYPGVDKKTLTELADIRDESFHVDPIDAALSKLEGTYTKGPRTTSLATSITSSAIERKVENLNIRSNPNSKRRSFFIDQRRKTKQFLLTPVVQKDVSFEESSPKILLDLLINYQINNDILKLANSSNHVSFILNYDSKTLANQFTLIEKDALLEIDWSELVELKWNSEEVKQINSWLEILIQNERLNGIDLCISRFNLTVNWIISEIVLTQDLTLRKLTIQRFIHIAQNCRALQNYSTLMQILLALSSEKIQRLKETWRNVEPGDILIFKNLEPILSPMKNFLNLRTELNKMKPSLGAAPFLGLYLSDLLFNKEKKSFKDGMVNFGKFQHDAKIIKSLIKCIQWSMLYKLDVDEEVLSKCLYIKSLTEDEMNECLSVIS